MHSTEDYVAVEISKWQLFTTAEEEEVRPADESVEVSVVFLSHFQQQAIRQKDNNKTTTTRRRRSLEFQLTQDLKLGINSFRVIWLTSKSDLLCVRPNDL